MTSYQQLFDAAQMNDAIDALAGQIAANFGGSQRKFALVGIHQLGVPLAEKLCEKLAAVGCQPDFGMLDITMYRDDIGTRNLLPRIHETVIPFDVDSARLILVDDVLSTGRTIRAALDAVTDYGRPALIRLAVLVDRGGVEYPIRADYIGWNIESGADRKILVEFSEEDGRDGVYEVEWKRSSGQA